MLCLTAQLQTWERVFQIILEPTPKTGDLTHKNATALPSEIHFPTGLQGLLTSLAKQVDLVLCSPCTELLAHQAVGFALHLFMAKLFGKTPQASVFLGIKVFFNFFTVPYHASHSLLLKYAGCKCNTSRPPCAAHIILRIRINLRPV